VILGVMSRRGWIVGTFAFTSRFLTLAKTAPSSFRLLTSRTLLDVGREHSRISRRSVMVATSVRVGRMHVCVVGLGEGIGGCGSSQD